MTEPRLVPVHLSKLLVSNGRGRRGRRGWNLPLSYSRGGNSLAAATSFKCPFAGRPRVFSPSSLRRGNGPRATTGIREEDARRGCSAGMRPNTGILSSYVSLIFRGRSGREIHEKKKKRKKVAFLSLKLRKGFKILKIIFARLFVSIDILCRK